MGRSKKQFLVLLVFLCTITMNAQKLHDLMTEEELAFYLGVVSASAAAPEYQVVFLTPPIALEGSQANSQNPEVEELKYDFTAFDTPINLRLRKNFNLITPAFTTFHHDGNSRRVLVGDAPQCHFLHQGNDITAAISMCESELHTVRGVVLLQNDTLQISPLSPRLRTLMERRQPVETTEGQGPASVPHLVRRAPLISHSMLGDALPLLYDREAFQDNPKFQSEVIVQQGDTHSRLPRAAGGDLILELAIFFDEAGYRLFAPFFNNDEAQIRDMLLAYMNAIQALYVHPSLGRTVQLAIVRLELFARQPSDLPHYAGERGQLLDSFCAYNEKHNPADDSNPAHWDMGLYVSGLDFFAYEGGRQSGVTMGLATVGGVCTDKYACVIAELGTVNSFGKPYPSAGFTSVYVLAHEMGHNLGMHHDSTGNNCPKEGYVMSPSRGTNGETQWSPCSASVLTNMDWAKCLNDKPGKIPTDRDHTRFRNIPGQFWGAKRQCEVLLRDKDATLQSPEALQEICENLRCKTPHRSGFYFAGPALEGTACGPKLWCEGGRCVPVRKIGVQKPITEFPGGWSKWKPDACQSGCTTKSRGYQSRRRACDNPKPINTEEGCDGPSFDVALCKDDKICKKRMTTEEYASGRCKEFSKLLPDLDPKGSGLQAPYEDGRLWMPCSVFCRRKDTGAYYTPRFDLNDLGVDPYFPDGTLCHNDGKKDYFCLQHHCLPEDFKDEKPDRQIPEDPTNDVDLAQNAGPNAELSWPEKIVKYLSLGLDGKTLLGSLGFGRSEDMPPLYSETDWEDKDYREIPH